jgi:hypothetical protein
VNIISKLKDHFSIDFFLFSNRFRDSIIRSGQSEKKQTINRFFHIDLRSVDTATCLGMRGCLSITLTEAIFKMATEDFPVLLAPLEVFDRKYLVEYPSRKIWLSEAEAWLPSNGSLFEGRAG